MSDSKIDPPNKAKIQPRSTHYHYNLAYANRSVSSGLFSSIRTYHHPLFSTVRCPRSPVVGHFGYSPTTPPAPPLSVSGQTICDLSDKSNPRLSVSDPRRPRPLHRTCAISTEENSPGRSAGSNGWPRLKNAPPPTRLVPVTPKGMNLERLDSKVPSFRVPFWAAAPLSFPLSVSAVPGEVGGWLVG